MLHDNEERMKPVWEQTFVVRSYDVDAGWKLRLPTLFSYMQEAAVNHSYDLGVGYHDLEPFGTFWVLSRIKLRFERMPGWKETVTVRTWPKGKDRLFALRDFLVLDQDNRAIIAVTSLWILINKESHRPQRIQSLPVTLPENPGVTAFDEHLDKIKPLGPAQLCHAREVMTGDLDVNRHVNNARYVDWIMDCFAPGFAVQDTIKTLQVNYVDEAAYKDRVIMNMAEQASPRTSYIEGLHADTQSPVVQALIEWA